MKNAFTIHFCVIKFFYIQCKYALLLKAAMYRCKLNTYYYNMSHVACAMYFTDGPNENVCI